MSKIILCMLLFVCLSRISSVCVLVRVWCVKDLWSKLQKLNKFFLNQFSWRKNLNYNIKIFMDKETFLFLKLFLNIKFFIKAVNNADTYNESLVS